MKNKKDKAKDLGLIIGYKTIRKIASILEEDANKVEEIGNDKVADYYVKFVYAVLETLVGDWKGLKLSDRLKYQLTTVFTKEDGLRIEIGE